MESITINKKSYDPGTLVITRKGNEKQGINFDNVIQNGAKIFNRSLTPASSGFVSKGKDFGSSSMKVIKNSLARIASNDTPFAELVDQFTKTRAIVYSDRDPVEQAKILSEQAANIGNLKIFFGIKKLSILE